MIHVGDCRDILPTMAAESVHTCVTSPPYFGLRDYGHGQQIGLEPTPDEFVAALVEVFRAVRRVLRDDGTLWLNLGDSYAGSWGAQGHGPSTAATMSRHQVANHPKRAQQTGTIRQAGVKPKDLYGIPWRVAFALQADGWYLRQDIIWAKPNPMPESVTDRCTKAHEYLFLLSKSPRYYFDAEAIKEQAAGLNNYPPQGGPVPGAPAQSRMRPSAPRGSFAGKTEAMADSGRNAFRAATETRNKRSVWTVPTKPFAGAHFATFPQELIEPCVLAGAAVGGLVLDPFLGAGTTAVVAERLGRRWVGCELNPEYAELASARLRDVQPGLALGDAA